MSQLSDTGRAQMQAAVRSEMAKAARLSRGRDERGPSPRAQASAEVHEQLAEALVCVLVGGACLGGHVHEDVQDRQREIEGDG
jgi:hypothetical protein